MRPLAWSVNRDFDLEIIDSPFGGGELEELFGVPHGVEIHDLVSHAAPESEVPCPRPPHPGSPDSPEPRHSALAELRTGTPVAFLESAAVGAPLESARRRGRRMESGDAHPHV